jgi:hypothetical protein
MAIADRAQPFMGQYVGDPLQRLVGRQHFLLNGPSKFARYPLSGVAWFGPQLRTSNDHSFIVGVP